MAFRGNVLPHLSDEQKREYLSQEQMMINLTNSDKDVITAFNKIPYFIINDETEDSSEFNAEITKILRYYKIYLKGADFSTEGTNGDYIPSELKSRLCYTLINKEARFLFAQAPDITVTNKGSIDEATEEIKNNISVLDNLVKTILKKNNFEDILLRAAKDCFIGKRVAAMVNFNESYGVTISFIPSTQFYFETQIDNPNKLSKFVSFQCIKNGLKLTDRRYFKKKYTLENNGVFLEETIFDGSGNVIEELTKRTKILLDEIPCCVFLNDGLLSDNDGESEVRLIYESESYFSKLSNADIDAGRKSMNPIRYTVDMDAGSTENLSSSPGAFWDLATDQIREKSSPQVGLLEPAMTYSTPLKTTLERLKNNAYDIVDVPNINLETMRGSITTGKGMKAIYWSLIVRCQEKMKMWGPNLKKLIEIIIKGSFLYPNCIKNYTENPLVQVGYEIVIEQNTPLPEDEIEEKNMDLAEVNSNVMSKKAYMKKWRGLTDAEADEELRQIALERQLLEDSMFDIGQTVTSDTDGLNPLSEGI